MRVSRIVQALESVFQRARDKHEAHRRAAPILQDAAADTLFLREVFEQNLTAPFFNQGHYPQPAFPVARNGHFELVVNAWIPRADGRTDLSTKCVHHHGVLLLTTTTIHGPGYEHWMFEPARLIDATRNVWDIRLKGHPRLERGSIGFVGSYEPHCPFFPEATSLTLALWSTPGATTVVDHIKRHRLLHSRAAKLREVASRIGLTRSLDLRVIEDYDYYPLEAGFQGMKTRQEFERGPNEDHLQSTVHLMQVTGNASLAPKLIELADRASTTLLKPSLLRELARKMDRGVTVNGCLSDIHVDVPHANFTKDAVRAAQLPAATAA